MAQSMAALPEQVFVECRALVFCYDVQLNRWSDVGEQNVFSRIQLIGSRPHGSTGKYRVFGRLESTGATSLNFPLTDKVEYVVTSPFWHQIRITTGVVYGLRVSSDIEGTNFSVIIQHTLRSLQGTQNQPPWPVPPDSTAGSPGIQSVTPPVGMPRSPDPSAQDGGRAKRRRDFDIHNDALCSTLSEAIMNGKQDQAVDVVRRMVVQRLNLSIKLKNPTLVTMDSGVNTITIRVVVEDKESSGGTFSIKVSPTSTIERLQQEVFDRYGFPVQVQKWIIGKRLPKPGDTLHDLNVRQSGTTVFLYLLSGKTVGLRRSDVERFGRGNPVAGSVGGISGGIVGDTAGVVGGAAVTAGATATVRSEGHMRYTVSEPTATVRSEVHMRHATSTPNLSDASAPRTAAAPNRAEQMSLLHPSSPASGSNQLENSGPATLPFHMGMNISTIHNLLAQQSGGQGGGAGNVVNPIPQQSFVNNLEPVEQQAEEDGRPVGWTCPACTFINQPTRPGCEICCADRPADYVVPAETMLDERERIRIAAEEREEALFQQAERTRQQEEQMARQRNLATLLQTAQQSLIPNQEEFDCGICFTPVEPEEGVVLRECLHRFCRDCLIAHIRHATDPEVQCPHQDDNYACHATITGQEIQALLPVDDFNKFLNRSLATAESQAANSFHCKTPNCHGWCLYEDNVNTFHCPVCAQPNCLTCKAIHVNMNCKEYQDDVKRRSENDEAAKKTQKFLEDMVAAGNAMHCPVCEIILIKKDGCDWMRCSMCRTEICWATRGPRWGPGGSGDISGGCKCRVGGKKCHPHCRNCH